MVTAGRGEAHVGDQATFGGLLRGLRAEAGLTQEELAEASGVRPRSISDLERGVAVTPHRATVRRLADALHLIGLARAEFEAVARGRPATAGAGTAATATRALPRDVASFTGREQELRELMGAAAGDGCVVGVHAIGGMAGIGKTAFAVHAAHQLADRFPAGQVFLPLHGHTPGRGPVEPGDALASLLLTAGIPAGQVPPDLEARAALWRDRLAGKELLLILDDAANSDQVLPLLPGTAGSLVLITSRRHLSALDATTISLDTLAAGEAAELLARLASRPGLGASDSAVGQIARLCGYLPLAIGMMARQLHHHPAWTAAGRAAELASARDRLELMVTENLSVAAAFDLSYVGLTEGQQRLFRRLGLHPGGEFDAYAAAALDGTGLAAARRGLEGLYDQYLIAEPAEGRYRMHDLIRQHARTLAGRLDRDGATTRLLDYYQHAAALAGALIAHQGSPVPAPADDATSAAVPAMADREQALAWIRAERDGLLACLDHVTRDGQHARVVALTSALAELLRRDGPLTEAATRHAAALESARHLGDMPGRARALNDLGVVRRATGDYPGAAADLEQAQAVYRDLGHLPGQARALNDLGVVRRVTGDYPGAAADLEQALAVYRDAGDRLGQARALNELGAVRHMTGDFRAAAIDLEQALAIYRDAGDRLGQASALNYLGAVRQDTGDYPGSAGDLEQALAVYRDVGDRLGQANALTFLGAVRQEMGDYPGATAALEQGLAIHRDLGHRLGQAGALTYLGTARRAAGGYQSAATDLEQALAIYRDLGDRGGEVTVLNETGTLHRLRGEPAEAEAYHQQALKLARAIGSPWDEAHALAGLARCAAAGRTTEANSLLRQAHTIFQRIGAAEASAVLAELNAFTSPESRD
jgi:tetratricopeptide (TPR) repeat protein/transcriptional regulator with XRE-family HTH domain